MLKTVTCFLCLALIGAMPALGQGQEQHLGADAAGALCTQSAFFHGYVHGYENGFRVGDLDIHLGHKYRDVEEVKEFRRVAGYRSEFGDRKYFRLGYQQGFRAGYADVRNGVAFRAIAELRQAADGYGSGLLGKDFDQAASAGYDAGLSQASQQPRLISNFQHATENCKANHRSTAYCDAYVRGFRLGSADGFTTRSTHRTETARADVGR